MAMSPEEKRERAVMRTWDRYKALMPGKCKNDCLKTFQELRRLECATIQGFDDSADEYGWGSYCISSGKFRLWNNCDAGHFISRKHTAVAFSRFNVWPQDKGDNQWKYGNCVAYRKGLVERIGEEEVRLLEAWKDTEVVFTKFQYAQMKEAFRAMVKREKARLGI